MAKDRIGTVLDIPKEERTYSKNMFTTLVGDKYARKFHEVYYSDLQTRDEKMKEIYEGAKNDTKLTDIQRRTIYKCYVAYLSAIGSNCNISLPLVAFIDKKKPNLAKFIKSNSRFKRTVYDLYDVITRSGFNFEAAHFPIFLKVFMVQFRQREESSIYEEDLTFESIIFAALSKFSRTLPITAVANIWYVLIFMKNIALLAYIKPDVYNESEELKKRVPAIIRTINTIYVLEMKRAGIIKQDTKTDAVTYTTAHTYTTTSTFTTKTTLEVGIVSHVDPMLEIE